jgi:hypothetical protein
MTTGEKEDGMMDPNERTERAIVNFGKSLTAPSAEGTMCKGALALGTGCRQCRRCFDQVSEQLTAARAERDEALIQAQDSQRLQVRAHEKAEAAEAALAGAYELLDEAAKAGHGVGSGGVYFSHYMTDDWIKRHDELFQRAGNRG